MISQTKEERWHFTRAQADAMYKKAIAASKKKPLQGIPKEYMRVELKGQGIFYRVNHLQDSERMRYERELWSDYGFKTVSYSNLHGFYVRRA